MGIFMNIVKLFWNKYEKRLRSIWRIGLHSGILITFTIMMTVALSLLVVITDMISGTNLRNALVGTDPMQVVENPWVGTVLLSAATFLGVLAATFVSGRWIDRRKFKEFGLAFSKRWWADFVFGLGLGAFLMGLVFLVGWLTGNVQINGYIKSLSQGSSFIAGFLQSLILFVFVGFYEELLSRGYHLINLAEGFNGRLLGKRWALILAFLVSSLAFGVLHMGNPEATWVSTLNISLAGVFLGLGMVLTGSLAIPIGLHITWNFFQGNIFGFPVSGIRPGATIIATESIGKDWITGGGFGPEAGVLGLGAMAVGIVLTLMWLRRRGGLALQTDLAVYAVNENNEAG